MSDRQVENSIKAFVTVTFVAMIIVNALANILPINGQGTGQVSDSYPNLFAPAGFTFGIWGLIYLLLGGYTLFQLGFFQGNQPVIKKNLLNRIGIYFSISSIANSAWIFAWHYHLIPLSLGLMAVILVCLIMINQMTCTSRFTVSEWSFIRLPFSVYFGWITVATIANGITLLVSLGWNGIGLAGTTWTVIMLFIGTMIGIATLLKNRDGVFGLVLVWAYVGIWQKHTSIEGFGGRYPEIITAVLVCMCLLLLAEVVLVILRVKRPIAK